MTVETPVPAARLDSVQALRGIAALLVVLYHSAAIWREHAGLPGAWPGPWDQGYAGVDLFFVISGFIMVWIAGGAARGPRRAGRFLWRRVTRIYPLWWIFCGLMALYFLLAYGQPASPAVVGPDGAWGYLLASLALWPQSSMPVLQVGWTLTFEMGFYLIFAALLLLPPRIRPWLLLLWGAGVLVGLRALSFETMPGSPFALMFHPLVLEFLLGAAVAYILPRWRDEGWARFIALAGAFAFAAWLAVGLDPAEPAFPAQRVLVFGAPAALLLAGLVRRDVAGGRVPAWLERLGDQSYALYLSHFLVLLAFKRVLALPGWLEGGGAVSLALFMALGTGLSLLVGWAAHRALERPLLHLARRRAR